MSSQAMLRLVEEWWLLLLVADSPVFVVVKRFEWSSSLATIGFGLESWDRMKSLGLAM